MNALLSAPERTVTQSNGTGYPVPRRYWDRRRANFPVALRLLPGAVRNHLWRSTGLPVWPTTSATRRRATPRALARLAGGRAGTGPARGAATHPCWSALTPTIRQFDLPLGTLSTADRSEPAGSGGPIATRRSRIWSATACCRRLRWGNSVSARSFEVSSPERIALSDEVCIGLQVVEHLQDVAEDIAGDRVYLPQTRPPRVRLHR